ASLSVSANYLKDRASRFYLGEYPDPTATETFGNRYLFAPLTQTVLGLTSRIEFFFSPDLSLQVYAQPFIATADYRTPGSLDAPRSYQFTDYGTGPSTLSVDAATGLTTVDADGAGPAPAFSFPAPDFRTRSLRSNMVLRWEYRPGSTLFLVWNQNRFGFAADPRFRAFRDLGDIFGDDMQNVLLVKANYYFSF
ncbi:MAG: hypothetical protein AB7L66_01615, partial [Gemmatimonadales bacterium]